MHTSNNWYTRKNTSKFEELWSPARQQIYRDTGLIRQFTWHQNLNTAVSGFYHDRAFWSLLGDTAMLERWIRLFMLRVTGVCQDKDGVVWKVLYHKYWCKKETLQFGKTTSLSLKMMTYYSFMYIKIIRCFIKSMCLYITYTCMQIWNKHFFCSVRYTSGAQV